MKRPDERNYLGWLRQLHWLLFGSSLVVATVAFYFEGREYPLGSFFLLLCTLVICCWCLTRKPSLYIASGMVAAAVILLGWTSGDPETTLFQLILLSAAVGWRVDSLKSSLLLLFMLALAPVIGSLGPPEESNWGWWNWSMGILIIWSFGRVIQLLEHTLQELTEARSQLIDSAAKEERLRISRDVHDMVGHSLTALLLNIRAARRALNSDRVDYAEVDRTLSDAERIGVDGIADVRAMWIDLHADARLNQQSGADDSKSLTSAPDGETVLQLLAQQDQMSISTSGDVAALNGPMSLVIYRVLQECITNILKHAPAGTATIKLNAGIDEVQLTATNPVQLESQVPTPLTGKTIGLISMRERVVSLGGTFQAGVEGDSWQINCKIPRHG